MGDMNQAVGKIEKILCACAGAHTFELLKTHCAKRMPGVWNHLPFSGCGPALARLEGWAAERDWRFEVKDCWRQTLEPGAGVCALRLWSEEFSQELWLTLTLKMEKEEGQILFWQAEERFALRLWEVDGAQCRPARPYGAALEEPSAGVLAVFLEPGLPLQAVSQRVCGWLENTAQQLNQQAGGRLRGLVHPEDWAALEQATLRGAAPYKICCRLRQKTEGWLWVCGHGKVEEREGRRVLCLALTDVSRAMRRQEQLEQQAWLDPLTQVYNRRGAAVQVARHRGENGAMLFFDIDNFKALNDCYGHLGGDAVLLHLVEILRAGLGPEDVAARMGGDEFMLYLIGTYTAAQLEQKAQGFCRAFSQCVSKRYPKGRAGLTVGGVIATPGMGFQELYRRADEALYRAKTQQKGGAQIVSIGQKEQE